MRQRGAHAAAASTANEPPSKISSSLPPTWLHERGSARGAGARAPRTCSRRSAGLPTCHGDAEKFSDERRARGAPARRSGSTRVAERVGPGVLADGEPERGGRPSASGARRSRPARSSASRRRRRRSGAASWPARATRRAAAQQHRGVLEPLAGRALGRQHRADHDRDPPRGRRQRVELAQLVAHEAVALEEVERRVAGQRELGEDHERRRPRPPPCAAASSIRRAVSRRGRRRWDRSGRARRASDARRRRTRGARYDQRELSAVQRRPLPRGLLSPSSSIAMPKVTRRRPARHSRTPLISARMRTREPAGTGARARSLLDAGVDHGRIALHLDDLLRAAPAPARASGSRGRPSRRKATRAARARDRRGSTGGRRWPRRSGRSAPASPASSRRGRAACRRSRGARRFRECAVGAMAGSVDVGLGASPDALPLSLGGALRARAGCAPAAGAAVPAAPARRRAPRSSATRSRPRRRVQR